MHPAFSVIFLTTLIGAGQGLFLALFTADTYQTLGLTHARADSGFYALGGGLALSLLGLGLFASFFHLGHPERAWRAAARWRTSWLSREVIALPVFMGLVALYGGLHYLGVDINLPGVDSDQGIGRLTWAVGLLATLAAFALYVCTGMIYASIKFIQEWACALTVINYTLLGMASGFTLATAFAAYAEPDLIALFGNWAIILTVLALLTRAASLIRNGRIKYKSSLQTAIGVRHNQIVQKSRGFMGSSFNTREFFHGKGPLFLKTVKWSFLLLVFPLPLILLGLGMSSEDESLLALAIGLQYLGLIAERWFFFAQASHPQNLYYQTI